MGSRSIDLSPRTGVRPIGRTPVRDCEANAMDRQPAPKHRRVETERMVPGDLPPWEDQPTEEGRSPTGDEPSASPSIPAAEDGESSCQVAFTVDEACGLMTAARQWATDGRKQPIREVCRVVDL